MARVIGDGVAAGVVDHLRKNLSVTSSVAVDGLSTATGSVVSTGGAIVTPLEFQPLLVMSYTTFTVAMGLVFKDMPFTALLKVAGVTFGVNRLTLGDKQFTIGIDASINPAGGGSTIYWLALGDTRVLNARGASTSVQ